MRVILIADRPRKATKISTKLNTYRSKVETLAAWNRSAIGQVETMGLILFGIIGRLKLRTLKRIAIPYR